MPHEIYIWRYAFQLCSKSSSVIPMCSARGEMHALWKWTHLMLKLKYTRCRGFAAFLSAEVIPGVSFGVSSYFARVY